MRRTKLNKNPVFCKSVLEPGFDSNLKLYKLKMEDLNMPDNIEDKTKYLE